MIYPKISSLVKVYRKSGDDEYYMVVDFKSGPQIVHISGIEWKKLAIRCQDEGIKPVTEGDINERTTIHRLV